MTRILEIHCSDEMKDIIADALRLYAQMAFPESGSPCQMVSRDALYTAADEFEDSFARHGTGRISSRMRVMLKAAVKNYFNVREQQTGQATDQQCRLVLDVCSGQPRTGQDLDAARQADSGAST